MITEFEMDNLIFGFLAYGDKMTTVVAVIRKNEDDHKDGIYSFTRLVLSPVTNDEDEGYVIRSMANVYSNARRETSPWLFLMDVEKYLNKNLPEGIKFSRQPVLPITY